MGGSSSPKQTETTSNNSEPWSAQQPGYKKAIAGAQNAYDANIGGEVYQGSTVTPFSSQSTSAFNSIENNANANTNGRGASGQYQGIINSGGFNGSQLDAMNQFRQTANGSGYNSEQQDAVDQFRQTANGSANDDAYQSMRANTLADAQHGVNESFSGAGRYGGAMHQGAVADTLADAGARMDYGQLQRQDTANSNLFSMGQQAQSNRNMANSNLFNMGQQGQNNIGNAYEGLNAGNQDLMNVGSQYEDLATRVKNDELRIFNESQNKPWEMIAKLNNGVGGAGNYGSSTTTATSPGANPWGQAAGAALGIGSLFGGF
jgi:hypothetical protein